MARWCAKFVDKYQTGTDFAGARKAAEIRSGWTMPPVIKDFKTSIGQTGRGLKSGPTHCLQAMSDITEIYICKDGQSLNEGKLEISHSVETRDDAESDAIQRCRFDPSVAKIGYYAMSDDGSFRNFYTYRNPNPAAQRRKSAVLGTPPPDRAKRRKAARPPPSLWRRIVGFFQET